jgi:hypothetical protein
VIDLDEIADTLETLPTLHYLPHMTPTMRSALADT